VDKVKEFIVKKSFVVAIALVFAWIYRIRWLFELTYPDNIHGWRTSLR